jgi:hypothetical protein
MYREVWREEGGGEWWVGGRTGGEERDFGKEKDVP